MIKHYIQFYTACGCTRIQEWHERPYPKIVVPISRHVSIEWEGTVTTRGFPKREFEYDSRIELPNGDMIWTYKELPV